MKFSLQRKISQSELSKYLR